MNAAASDPPSGVKQLPQAFLTPGTLYCSARPTVVSTVLGSCVAVCLIDRYRRAAGMNHFVLPYSAAGENSLRYGEVALERLRERMARLGCNTEDLSAKVFGGAAVLPFGDAEDTVGTNNVNLAVEWLRNKSIAVLARRTGGRNGLLIWLNTGSGGVLVRKITSQVAMDITGQTTTYDSSLVPAIRQDYDPAAPPPCWRRL